VEYLKVLWHTNIILPIFAKELNQKPSVYGGWMTGIIESIIKDSSIKLVVMFPNASDQMVYGNVSGITYYGIPQKYYGKNEDKLIASYQDITDHENPEILHIFGTEFPHTLSLIKVFNQPEKTIINLQGLVSKISEVYTYGLPNHVIYRYTLRDIIRHRNIYLQQLDFKYRGLLEIEAISLTHHVIGRTTFDHEASKEINPGVNYHKLNEILRPEFYKHQWNIKDIKRHSILMSQSHFPFKGLHLVIPEFANILKLYPDAKLYITGKKPFDNQSLVSRLKIDSYGLYIKRLLKKYKVFDEVIFLGEVSEQEMCNIFLSTHVFLSSSTIENESNAVSEAKILGVPTVSSNVGGISSRITHNLDGLLYPLEESNQMTEMISSIFSNDQLAIQLSTEAKIRAKLLFDKNKNINLLKKIYQIVHK